MFIHLHTHSEYTVLDGIVKVKHLVGKAKEFGQPAIALTDKGNLYGVFEFWKECHEQEVKPILGAELFVTPKSRFDKNAAEKTSNIVILAKNLNGYKNLIQIVSRGHTEGFYYKPRIDKDLLKEFSSDLIILSGGRYSEMMQQFELGNDDRALESAKWYKETFGENFYIELTDIGDDHQKEYIKKTIKIAKDLDIPLVASADIFYMKPEDAEAREIVWAINDGKKLADPSRRQDKEHQLYMKSPEEMIELWKELPEAIENTQKIADQIEDYKIGHGKVEPQSLDIPEGKTAGGWLRELAFDGAKTKFPLDEKGNLPENVIERLEYELGLIETKGYNHYFLVVMEYVNWANNNNIPTTCRGSGASSCVAYCIGITPLDPLRWKLPFERFLNPERNSFPDFDADFADYKRAQVFEHMIDKYGADRTCYIGAIGRMKSKAVIRDVGRVMGIPLSICDKLSKMVTVKFGRPASLKEMMDPEKHPDFASMVGESEDLQKLIALASRIENNMRQMSTHACGFLCTPDSVMNYIPLQKETKGDKRIITQIEGAKMEDLGMMKFDFLGLSNLSTIAFAVDIIEQYHGNRLNMRKIPEDDPKTFALLQKGDTAGVFQLESGGMQKYLKDLKPTTIEDISFMCAAYRPGPMQFIPPYINRKHGREEVTYPHEVLKPVLEETYGYAIYQEQVMEIAKVFSGYSLGAADMLRRAMGKKKAEVMAAEKVKFIEGAEKLGHTAAEAEKIFSYLEPFADYGFNKAHSAAYCMIAYQTAYLKANYTIEFIAALMQTDLEDAEKLTRDIVEAQKHDIEVLAPDVNYSGVGFSIDKTQITRIFEGTNYTNGVEAKREDNNEMGRGEVSSPDSGKNVETRHGVSGSDIAGGKIRFGMGGLKTVGLQQVEEIVRARGDKPFATLEDFLSRIDLKKVSKNAIEVLIKVGAMESFGNRGQLLQVFQSAYESAVKMSKSAGNGNLFMFDEEEVRKIDPIKLPIVDDISQSQKVEYEKEYLGVYFSVHPLSRVQPILAKKKGAKTLYDLKKNCRVKDKITIAACIKKMRCVNTKKDNRKMCFGTLEDPDYEINFTVFPTIFEKFEPILEEGKSYIITGKKDFREEQHGILVDTLELINFDDYDGMEIEQQPKLTELKDMPKSDDLVHETVSAASGHMRYESAGNSEPVVIQNTNPIDTNSAKVSDNIVSYNYTVPETVVPVNHHNNYKGVKVVIPQGTDAQILKRLNEYFLSNPGDGEIMIIMKAEGNIEKKMVLNNKLKISKAVEDEVKNIAGDAGLSFY
jgi:DNA polymerase-3 subunit alpha